MTVFDNMYAKPPQAGEGFNAHISVAVLFHVVLDDRQTLKEILKGGNKQFINAGVFSGQYNFETCTWSIHGLRDDYLRELPMPEGVDWSNQVPDYRVDRWWHLPEYESICETYSKSGSKLRSTAREE